MPNHKDWKRDIDVKSQINLSVKPLSFVDPEGKKVTFKDYQKGDARLRVKVKMTFSGLITDNNAVYLPDEMFRGASTFLKPFGKPVLRHHDKQEDAVGRIIDVRYVDTFNDAIAIDSSVADLYSLFAGGSASLRKRLKTVRKMIELSQREDYNGLGHVLGLWDISDEDAIQKIIDGRYYTVSTDFKPGDVYCSACILDEDTLTNWRVDDCEHWPGDVYGGEICVKIPIGFDYKEASFVNIPAAPAYILEVGDNLSFSDAISTIKHIRPYEILSDAILSIDEIEAIDTSGNRYQKLPETFRDYEELIKTPHRTNDVVIGDNEQGGAVCPQGSDMKLSELVKDTDTNYAKLAEHLCQDAAKLTSEFLKELDESVFIGPNRTFPIKDLAHADAAKALLEQVEDSDTKATLLEALEATRKKLDASDTDNKGEDPKAGDTQEDSTSEGGEGTDEIDGKLEELGLAKITKEGLQTIQDELEELKASKSILAKRVSDLKGEIQGFSDSHSELIKEQKEILSERLLERQLACGLTIEDSEVALEKYRKRSIESIRDSIADLVGHKTDGTANTPDGRRVDVSGSGEDTDEDDVKVQDKLHKKYKSIVDEYWDVYYSSSGAAGATRYLELQKRKGLIPDNLVP